MKILLTGASSFTGHAFVAALAEKEHKIFCTLTKDVAKYDGLKRERLDLIKDKCEFLSPCSFGDSAFVAALKDKQIDMLCHHGADVTNYRSEEFSVANALSSNINNIREVLQVFKTTGKAILLTGSVFESDEGDGDGNQEAFSPYGLSKAFSYQAFRYYCNKEKVRLGKFVIPNPFGPLEEERFTNFLVKSWTQGQKPAVSTPDYVRDNIHVELLAKCYVKFADELGNSEKDMRLNPSGYAGSQGGFATLFATEMNKRLSLDCQVVLNTQTEFNEPLKRINTDNAASYAGDWNEEKSWDAIANYYKRKYDI